MKRIRIALFKTHAEREPVRVRLFDADIPAEIYDELYYLARLRFASRSTACVRLELPADPGERATQLLLEWDPQQDILTSAIRCSEYKLLQVDCPQVTQESFSTTLGLGLIAAVEIVQNDYYCELCHCSLVTLII